MYIIVYLILLYICIIRVIFFYRRSDDFHFVSLTQTLFLHSAAAEKTKEGLRAAENLKEAGLAAARETASEAARVLENGKEATLAAARELTREGQELIDEGIRAANELKRLAAEKLDKAIDAARDVASGAFDALSLAADGLLGKAKEAYDFLGKLENAFSGASGICTVRKTLRNTLLISKADGKITYKEHFISFEN